MTTTFSEIPRLFILKVAAWSAFTLVIVQFVLAGAALFVHSPLWNAHGAIGILLIIPIAILILQRRALLQQIRIRGWSWSLLVFYLMQVFVAALSEESGFIAFRAVHVANSASVLLASFTIAVRTIQGTGNGPWKGAH